MLLRRRYSWPSVPAIDRILFYAVHIPRQPGKIGLPRGYLTDPKHEAAAVLSPPGLVKGQGKNAAVQCRLTSAEPLTCTEDLIASRRELRTCSRKPNHQISGRVSRLTRIGSIVSWRRQASTCLSRPPSTMSNTCSADIALCSSTTWTPWGSAVICR